MTVDIVELTREWTTTEWLCGACQELRRGQRWTVKVIGQVDGLCADCDSRAQDTRVARGEPSPTVDFVPLAPTSRLPTAAERIERGLGPVVRADHMHGAA